MRRKSFHYGKTRLPKASRFSVIEMGDEYEVDKASRMLVRLGQFFSHKEHKLSTASDRFCPYVLLRGVTREQLAELKDSLWKHTCPTRAIGQLTDCSTSSKDRATR